MRFLPVPGHDCTPAVSTLRPASVAKICRPPWDPFGIQRGSNLRQRYRPCRPQLLDDRQHSGGTLTRARRARCGSARRTLGTLFCSQCVIAVTSELHAASFCSSKGNPRTLADAPRFVFGDRRQDVQRETRGVWIIAANKIDPDCSSAQRGMRHHERGDRA